MSAITVKVLVKASIEKAWQYWTEPQHIIQWNFASPEWHSPRAANDLRPGGSFNIRMEARDGSMGFDFEGKYTKVLTPIKIEYVLADGRCVSISFFSKGNDKTEVTETFDPESENSAELQRGGWQAILDNYKKYTENN